MAHQRYRKRKRKTFGRFVLKTMLFFCMCLALVMGATIFFKVETIIVEGNSHYSAEEIIAATNIQLGENLFSVQKEDISQNITFTLPYIQSIDIKLHLPTGIKLVVQEQVGMVELVTDQGTWYMGVQGKLLEYHSISPSTLPTPVPEEFPPVTTEPAEIPEQIPEEFSEESSEDDTILSTLQSESVDSMINSVLSWSEEPEYSLEFDPTDQVIIRVTGLTLEDPQAGELVQVEEGKERQLTALLALFQELEALGVFHEVSTIHVDKFNYLEFDFVQRFSVKLPFSGDFNYKLRALMAVVLDTEDYETGMMDLTQEHYAVLFTPD